MAPGGDGPPLVVIIIDDMGDRLIEGQRVRDLPGPVVCAMLPHTAHAQRLAKECHADGKEVMLHQPMQAMNGAPTGPGSVMLDMDREQFQEQVEANLSAVPHVSAVNNHMGSLLTQHPGHMAWLMEVLLRYPEPLVFVDSRTTPRTVAEQLAREQGVPAVRRDIFLDHFQDEESIRHALRRLVDLARRNGSAVAIGHPYQETLNVLEEEIPRLLAEEKVRLVSLRDLLAYRGQEITTPDIPSFASGHQAR
ncbi:MAG: divergent polysaccharide deacetylase family protein [Ectothiorhodospiraceae bacterium]|nr:divergent polysaccharide deacetylase family protein [Ectothiorhodospiraceae bacterium]